MDGWAVGDVAFSAPLFDDNPAIEDLLDFDAVAEVVVRVVTSGGLDPVTVGIHSAWGGGKSTALNLIGGQLGQVGHVLVVRIDPWEFENTEDLRGTLIAQVLDVLHLHVQEETEDPTRRDIALAKLDELRRRIAWGRVAKVLVTSAVTLSPNLPGLIEALTPKAPEGKGKDADGPQGMAGFRSQFESLMDEVEGINKVVVLVDDLDRCLPPTIMGTLEAIKLFLSVKKMAFVLAADEDLIRAAIEPQMEGAAKAGFAKLYTEKIVQLPISLPLLSVDQAEAYIALLLCRNAGALSSVHLGEVIAAARVRRRSGTAPYVVAGDAAAGPSARHLALAASIARGLSADVWRSPRAIKRFLNAFAVREHLAQAAGAGLDLDVLLKLYLLEWRYLPEFNVLAERSPGDRDALLVAWEEWALDSEHTASAPTGVGDTTRPWAASEPSLRGRSAEIDRYLSIAATLRSDVRFGGAVNARQLLLIEHLSHPSDATRAAALQELATLAADEQEIVVTSLCDQLTRTADPGHVIASLNTVTGQAPALADGIGRSLGRPAVLGHLQPHHVPYLKPFPQVLTLIVSTPGLDPDVVNAARAELDELPG